MAEIKIRSKKVIMVEGRADEFAPDVEMATGMCGFAILVPSGVDDNWLLDMIWRITVAYAGRPSLLFSRANVRTMVEAVMSRETRPTNSSRLKPSSDSRAAKASASRVTAGARAKSGSAESTVRLRNRSRASRVH